MKKIVFGLLGIGLLAAVAAVFYINRPKPAVETKFVQEMREVLNVDTKAGVTVKTPGDYALLENPKHTYQTFNNCGPATLSMMLSWHGKNVSQKELGDQMRPYQVASGDNDDKTIFSEEFISWAKRYGFESVSRVGGDINLLKTFTANGIPVVVKTWLHPNEDIGHFRIVRGFDEKAKVIIQDDSFEGPNRRISYFDFLGMWQPFNYDYIIVYTKDQKDLVEAIIGVELEDRTMWENMLTRAQKEAELDAQNVYPWFTISVVSYHLGKYQDSVSAFEKVENRLPRRMLWYQIEPIQAYRKLGQDARVFALIDKILSSGDRAFSELYMLRGEMYLEKGQTELAKREFELALFYNKNLDAPKKALENL